ncbi:hypothetical protein C8R45DRAFT_980661 [Mycena sanguinolenta]|nr:hypothetical protein C8R45DRAFT_980661 [Mycena sanguinolenta]
MSFATPHIVLDSPVKHILGTNAEPTDAESEIIGDLLESSRDKLADLTEKVARLRTPFDAESETLRHVLNDSRTKSTYIAQDSAALALPFDEATHERDELMDLIGAHLALLSPVRRLPEDILGSIFMETLSSTKNPGLSPEQPPLLLCQICQFWRAVALATPRLWASIHIVVSSSSRLPRLVEDVNAWLDRSGIVPLDISLGFSIVTYPFSPELKPLFSALTAVSRRWRNIQLAVTSYADLASLSPEDVPLLESIALENISIRSRVVTESPQNLLRFLGTNTLRSVRLSAACIMGNQLNLASLTHLNILDYFDGLSSDDALAILRKCPLLETCGFSLRGRNIPAVDLALPRLLHLTILHGYLPQDSQFFVGMALPTLRSFHCDSQTRVFPNTPVRCLFPPTVQLTCLKVDLQHLTSDTLLAALVDMPFLEELHILREPRVILRGHGSADAQFLTRFTVSTMCKRLRTLELLAFCAVSDEILLEFIQSRTEPHLTVLLSRLTCTFGRRKQFNIQTCLASAIANGLILDLKYPSRSGPVPIAPSCCSFEELKPVSQVSGSL